MYAYLHMVAVFKFIEGRDAKLSAEILKYAVFVDLFVGSEYAESDSFRFRERAKEKVHADVIKGHLTHKNLFVNPPLRHEKFPPVRMNVRAEATCCKEALHAQVAAFVALTRFLDVGATCRFVSSCRCSYLVRGDVKCCHYI